MEANKGLSEQERAELFEEFEKIEKEAIGEGKHAEYLKLVEKIENSLK